MKERFVGVSLVAGLAGDRGDGGLKKERPRKGGNVAGRERERKREKLKTHRDRHLSLSFFVERSSAVSLVQLEAPSPS